MSSLNLIHWLLAKSKIKGLGLTFWARRTAGLVGLGHLQILLDVIVEQLKVVSEEHRKIR